MRGAAIASQPTPPRRARLARARDDVLHYGPRAARIAAFASVAALVLSLPLVTAAPQEAATPSPTEAAASAGFLASTSPVARANSVPRGVVTQPRLPLTVTRDESAAPVEVRTYTVQEDDTLIVIAAHYQVSVATVAYNNGITDARVIHIGDVLRIPSQDGALYTVKDGDTPASVATKFDTDATTVIDANDLNFRPENFMPGKTVFVPVSGDFPGFALKDNPPVPAPYAGPPLQGPPPPQGPHRLAWPVAGVITQYFWYGHTGVDIAAPYGTAIHASDDGVISANGWVAVGGLRVCVTHSWGMMTCYYHTSVVYLPVGTPVKKGDTIAAIGLTGVTTGPHVHWEARLNGVYVNPLAY